MKTKATKPAAPAPAFDPATAQAVEPHRHDPTGRTVAFHQGDHFFSATGDFVGSKRARKATETALQPASAPAPAAPAQ